MRIEWPSQETAARLRSAAATMLAYRIPLWLCMWWGLLMLPVPADQRVVPDSAFLDGWFRWDANFYLGIAAHGYSNVPDAWLHRDTNFWPLFPLLMRGLSYLIPGHSLPLAAFLLNNTLLVGSVFLMGDIARRAIGSKAAPLATTFLLTYPFAYYYSAGYTESCYLFFALLTFFFGQRRQWLPAGLAAACASATRLQGVAVPAALAVLYFEECGWSVRRIRADAIYVLLGGLGPLSYALYLQLAFRDPFAFMAWRLGKDWGADVTWARFVSTASDFVRPSQWPISWIEATDAFHALCIIIVGIVAIVGRRRVRPHLTVFTLLSLVIVSRVWPSAGRYCSTLFPTYLVLASFLVNRPAGRALVMTTGLLFMALFAFMYSHVYWVS